MLNNHCLGRPLGVVYMICIATMFLFPRWKETYTNTSNNETMIIRRWHSAYEELGENKWAASVDFEMMAVEIIGISLLFGAAYVATKPKSKP